MKSWIDEGDIVDIYWEYIECEHSLTILYRPVATGDSWVCKRENGTVIYINSFSKMVKRS